MTLPISEMFVSIQGEGLLTGVPSIFIRTSGCNLRCAWCDTPYTSWEPEGEDRSLDELLSFVASAPLVRHVVITGGEPLLWPEVTTLTKTLAAEGLHVTIETAGTRHLPLPGVGLVSISPKLRSSTPTDDPTWSERHERRRIDISALNALLREGPAQLKFVLSSREDLDEIEAIVAQLEALPRDRVLLMPEARTPEELAARQGEVAALCAERGYRFSDRLHLRLYGATRGT